MWWRWRLMALAAGLALAGSARGGPEAGAGRTEPRKAIATGAE